MKKVYYPTWLLDSPGVTNLSVEHKTLLAASAVSMSMTACGVIRLTDRVLATLGFLPSEGVSAALELQRRGLAVFNLETREFFARGFYKTNLTPTEAGEGSPWAYQNALDLRQVIAQEVAAAVREEIAAQDLCSGEKLNSVGVPTNILTAMPRLANGKAWQKTERLVLLALYTDSDGYAPGLLVVNYDAIGALCTLPPAAVVEACETLAAGGAICHSLTTGEACVFARLTNATAAEQKAMFNAVPNIRDVTVKRATNRHLKLKFPTRNQKSCAESTASAPKEKKVKENKANERKVEEKQEAAPPSAAAVSNQSTSTSRPPRPGSCASGALSVQERMALNDALDLLRQNADLTGGDLERDRCTINKIRDLAGDLGDDQAVVAAMAGERLPTAAWKVCVAAGLQARAEGEKKRRHVAEAEAWWQAKVAAAQPETDPGAKEKGVELLAVIRRQSQARQRAG